MNYKILSLLLLCNAAQAIDQYVEPSEIARNLVSATEKKRNQIEPLNIGLCVMATGKYDVFIEPLYQSVKKHFFTEDGYKVWMFVFSDGQVPYHDDLIRFHQPRIGWPYDTMFRFHTYTLYREILATMDYLYFCDADMRFLAHVGPEILGDRVATRHPGFWIAGKERESYEKDPISCACIRPNEGRYYFCGGFYGGKSEIILQAIETMAHRVNEDLARGVIAQWHDESHWNRYCIDYPPTLILSSEYCSAEKVYFEGQPRAPKRIVNLDKNHAYFRAP